MVDGPAATIGAKIWASRFIPPVSALGTWAEGQVISIQIGSNNDSDSASGFGYCTGTTMVITSTITGTIGASQTVSVSNGSGIIIPGTTITSFNGTLGSLALFTISTNQMFGQVNLLLRSNTFSTTWVPTNSTVTGSSGTSPDSTNDAWLWQRSSTAAAYIQQILITKTAASLQYTLSVYAKAGTGNYLAMFLGDQPATNFGQVTFNVATGVISIPASVGGTYISASASIQLAANGFFRCSLTVVTDAVTSTFNAAFSGNANNVSLLSTDSLSNTTILIFGAQLEGGPVAQTYIPTAASLISNSILGFATPNQNSVQVHLDQIPTIAAQNVVVSYV